MSTAFRVFWKNFMLKDSVKEGRCFKNVICPSCIDLFLANSWHNFQNTTTICTGFSDFHKMVITILKTTFPKAKPKIISYRDFLMYVKGEYNTRSNENLQSNEISDYESLEKVFLGVLNTQAPSKKKVRRANHKPYVTKQLRKVIMKRSSLENKFYNTGEKSITAQ